MCCEACATACSLRALYGSDGTHNATHGSDSTTSAQREIKFYFPDLPLDPISDADTARAYVTEKLQPTLIKALTVLAKQKPAATQEQALTFLANWMLANNPNKPQMVLPEGAETTADDSTTILADAVNTKLAM